MKNLTVKQLAALSGVTVRTLHHYDEIGLLRPATVGANGYRYYGRGEQLRLQRILFHRELGVPLNAIAGLLDLEGDEQVAVLERHRERLAAERDRFGVLIETIDRTIRELQGGSMANPDLYKGFDPEKQAGYESWLIERYGAPMREEIIRSTQAQAKLSQADRDSLMRELADLEQALAGAMQAGVDPASDAVDTLLERHRAWVGAMWGRPCPVDQYAGLAQMYLDHPDFVARYEGIASGFTAYLTGAMKLHAARRTATPS